MMDLATGRMFSRPKCDACAMTRMVIERVELIAEKQGYKTLKFFNRKRKEMMLRDADLLAGVGGNAEAILDEDYIPLPPIDDGEDEIDPAEELDGDEQSITNEEIADLLNDENSGVADVNEDDIMPDLIPRDDGDESSDDEEEDGLEENCGNDESDQDSRSASTLGDAPSLVSEPGIRQSGRTNRTPARYNPSSGESYIQSCHNIVAQVKGKERCLEYNDSETQFVAHVLTKFKECYAQQYMLGKGLKEFVKEGPPAVKSELDQMHRRRCFKAVAVAELTRLERIRAQEGLMLLTRKRSGKVKGRLAYNGKPTRDWISKEDKSSPTVSNESLMLTCAIDAFEK